MSSFFAHTILAMKLPDAGQIAITYHYEYKSSRRVFPGMARKITMFELYFDGAHFGPSTPDTAEEHPDDEMAADYDEAESGEEMASGSRVRPALAAVGAIAAVSAAGFLAARRFRGGDEEFDFDEPDHDHVEIGEVEESDEPVAN